MKLLNLNNNADIGDEEAAMLLECLGYVKKLNLFNCNISPGMKSKLKERGKKVNCSILV